MEDKQKEDIYIKAQMALIALNIHPNDDVAVKESLNLMFRSLPNTTYVMALTVFEHASAGKYGIPFKFVPAIIGSWFHKELKESNDRKGARL